MRGEGSFAAKKVVSKYGEDSGVFNDPELGGCSNSASRLIKLSCPYMCQIPK